MQHLTTSYSETSNSTNSQNAVGNSARPRCESIESCKAQLSAMRIETRDSLEQSWKENENIRKECLSKIAIICRLQAKIGASNLRKCAAIEQIALIRGHNNARLRKEDDDGNLEAAPKETSESGQVQNDETKSFRNLFYRNRSRNRKTELQRAENILKITSRDEIMKAMGQALRESRQTLQHLRENRWIALRKRLSINSRSNSLSHSS